AGFTVQLVPMRDNFHEYQSMVELALSLSPHYRVGADWLRLSACGSDKRNAEISCQRLDPNQVVALDVPGPGSEEQPCETDDRLFAGCIAARRDFHVDPYGRIGFCAYVVDPELRYGLRTGTFSEAWDEFIPGLGDKVRGGAEYRENCGSCELRPDCGWCAVHGFLEHGRYSARVDYLCELARETRRFRKQRHKDHCRYFSIAGITLKVESDLPITDRTFHPKFREFQLEGPGEDTVVIRHHFGLPELGPEDLGQEVYRKAPWAIFRKRKSWIYHGILDEGAGQGLHQVVVFNDDHSVGEFYHPEDRRFRNGNLNSLTMFPTDQILLAPLLADRQACFLHSAGAVLDGQGLLFVGHSEAGKSTAVKLIKDRAEILCDDRNIVRREAGGFRVHGTWSHGEVPLVSAASARLRAILLLEKSAENDVVLVADRSEILGHLLACVIRPLETRDWWQKTLSVLEALCREVPCYLMRFDKSGRIVGKLEALARRTEGVEGEG
ncbi:MAG: hypothetical protein JSU73_01055, partial [candidate division WOR-3 bacterium]